MRDVLPVQEENSLNPGYLVEKSKKLVWAKFKDWNAGELRLLEVYLSRIDARNPESSRVRFTLKEYAELTGVSDLRHEQVEACTRKFLGNVVTIKHDDGWEMYTLFTVARCFKAKGQYVVEIDCNSEIKDVFFDIAKEGYIKYRLQSTIRMKKQYSIKLYGMILDMMDLPKEKQNPISLVKLREQLGIAPGSYEEFKIFKRDVLEAAVKEINRVSNIEVEYTCVRTGRKCTAIQFNAYFKAEQEFQDIPRVPEIPDRRKKSTTNRVDYSIYLSDLMSGEANKIGRMVKKKVKALYPKLPKDKVDEAVEHILRAAQERLLDGNKNYPDNPAAYVWSILSEDEMIGQYMPLNVLSYALPTKPKT